MTVPFLMLSTYVLTPDGKLVEAMAGQPEAAVVLRTPDVTMATAVRVGCAMLAPRVGPISGHSVVDPQPVDTLCLFVLPMFCQRNLKPSALTRLLDERG